MFEQGNPRHCRPRNFGGLVRMVAIVAVTAGLSACGAGGGITNAMTDTMSDAMIDSGPESSLPSAGGAGQADIVVGGLFDFANPLAAQPKPQSRDIVERWLALPGVNGPEPLDRRAAALALEQLLARGPAARRVSWLNRENGHRGEFHATARYRINRQECMGLTIHYRASSTQIARRASICRPSDGRWTAQEDI